MSFDATIDSTPQSISMFLCSAFATGQASISPRLRHTATTESMNMPSLAVCSSRPMLDNVCTAHSVVFPIQLRRHTYTV